MLATQWRQNLAYGDLAVGTAMSDDAPLVIETLLWRWTPEPPAKASWHFVTIVGEAAVAIRARAFELRAMGGARGFGSVRVRASLDGVVFGTSVFPHKESGGYLLPVKAEVRRKAGVAEGDLVEVAVWT